MKITRIACAGLRGATPEGGWTNELRPDDCVHSLIVVHTDDGLKGYGFTGTHEPFFDPASIARNDLPSRWAQLMRNSISTTIWRFWLST